MTVMLGDRKITVEGREAWALNALLERGETGVTPLIFETCLDRLWSSFDTERQKAWAGDRQAATRAGRLLNLYFEEFQHPDDRWPRHESGRLLTPHEITQRNRRRA
jgi:hypothetical protein